MYTTSYSSHDGFFFFFCQIKLPFFCPCTFSALLCVAWITNWMKILISIQTHPMHNMNYVDPFWRNELVLVFLCFTLHHVGPHPNRQSYHRPNNTNHAWNGAHFLRLYLVQNGLSYSGFYTAAQERQMNGLVFDFTGWKGRVCMLISSEFVIKANDMLHSPRSPALLLRPLGWCLHTSAAHQQRVLGPSAVTPRDLFNHKAYLRELVWLFDLTVYCIILCTFLAVKMRQT